MSNLIKRIILLIKNDGIDGLISKIYTKTIRIKFINYYRHKRQLEDILLKHNDNTMIVFPELVDWNIPLFQRPQHMALQLAKQDFLYFYCTPNSYDGVNGFREISKNCYLTNRMDLLIILRKKILHLYSTDMMTTNSLITKAMNRGDLILYEFIDEIHENITGNIEARVIEKHTMLLKNDKCIVIATADKLLEQVKNYRSTNMKLITNGVDYAHFQHKYDSKQCPVEILNIVQKNKPIIGYFGAFASWFDYNLIIQLALERPEYEILLIGWNYDNSINAINLGIYDNITVMGPVPYNILPQYASYFNVSIIPFVLNEITESTSPVKLFEYMALGKPIVTTNLPECTKYKSVLIGKNSDEFIENIDHAMILRSDREYIGILEQEALENTWEAKANSIAEILKENMPL